MNRLSSDEVRAAMRRRAPDGGRRKAVVSKRPRQSGPSVGAPSAAARAAPSEATKTAPQVITIPSGEGSSRRDAGAEEARAIVPMPTSVAAPAPLSGGNSPRAGGTSPGATQVSTRRGSGREGEAPAPSPSAAEGSARAPLARSDNGRSVQTEWAQTRGGWIFRAKVAEGASALDDAAVARLTAHAMMLPTDVARLGSEDALNMLNEPFRALARLAHGLSGMRTLLLDYDRRSRVIEERANVAEDKCVRLTLERDRAIRVGAQEATRLREEVAKLKKDLAKEQQLSTSRLKEVEDAEARAARVAATLEHTENQRQLAASRSLVSEGRARDALKEAAAAEERAKAAENRASKAVEEYKASAVFRDDLADASTDVYAFGFSDCKKGVAEKFPDLDLRSIVMFGEEEEGGDDEGADDAEGGEVVGGIEEGEAPQETDAPQVVEALPTVEASASMETPSAVDIPPTAETSPVARSSEEDDVVEVPPPAPAALDLVTGDGADDAMQE